MCFRKINDPGWPRIVTILPVGAERKRLVVPRTFVRAPSILAIEEVIYQRNNILPQGQAALHIALQRNSPFHIIEMLTEVDPDILVERDEDSGHIPLMTAIQHGCDINIVRYLIEREPSAIYRRSTVLGRTPLHICAIFACSTIQSTLNLGGGRIAPRGAHPDQCIFDENSLAVLRLVYDCGPLVIDMGDHQGDFTPLHAVITHDGPGRREVLGALLTFLACTTYQGITERDKLACRRFSMPDRRTPLHCACRPEHFDERLVELLIDCDPVCVALKCKQGITPLHLLCDQTVGKRRRASTISIEASQRVIQKMVAVTPKAAKIPDNRGRLPLHAYLESEYLIPKDPQTIATLLYNHPESMTTDNSTSAGVLSQVARHALLSRHTNQIRIPVKVLDDKHYATFKGILDPTLVCLWLILQHGGSARRIIEEVRLFISEAPLDPRYGINIRCVMRITIYWLFAQTYAPHLEGQTPPLYDKDESHFPNLIVKDIQKRISPLDLEAVTSKIVNVAFRDFETVSKISLLPEIDLYTVSLVFPTSSPYTSGPMHVGCPLYKALTFYKWCSNNSIEQCQINENVMMVFLAIMDVQTLVPLFHMALGFVHANKELFGQDLKDAFNQTQKRVACHQIGDMEIERNPSERI